MEELLKKLRAYRRRLELEDNLPYWESQKPEQNARIREMTENLQRKEQEVADLESPNILQRLFGRAEAQKEKLSRQIQEITSARMAAQWDLESLEKKIAAGKQELTTLADSRTVYEAAKAEMMLSPAQESRLMMEELSAFAPAAMEAAGRTLEALEALGPWLELGNRNGAQLQHTEDSANRLSDILSVLPEGVAPMGGFLRMPRDYLNDVHGLNQAKEQILRIINQLRLLLGE